MTDLVTKSLSQLARAIAVPAGALIGIEPPDGPMVSIELGVLFGDVATTANPAPSRALADGDTIVGVMDGIPVSIPMTAIATYIQGVIGAMPIQLANGQQIELATLLPTLVSNA